MKVTKYNGVTRSTQYCGQHAGGGGGTLRRKVGGWRRGKGRGGCRVTEVKFGKMHYSGIVSVVNKCR